ncbi:MAG: hypothetical protein ACSHX6_14980 [Akkermansiaceae bacterium]
MKRGTLYRVGHLCMLLNFIALVVTGVMRFTLPFSIAVTRVHMLCGFAISLLVAFHIIGRLRQMKSMVKSRSGSHYPSLIISLVLTGFYWSAAWFAWPGARQVVDLSYEARHKNEIFRERENVVGSVADSSVHTFKLSTEDSSVDVTIDWTELGVNSEKSIAIWVETKSGSMIETFHVSESLRFSDDARWEGAEVKRGEVLPIWRNRYTAICGIGPDGVYDAISGPTKNHKFDLKNNLTSREEFVVFVEINAANDNEPSVIYVAMIEPESNNPYTLLSLLGTGEGAFKSGSINYELGSLTTAKQLVEKILVHTVWDSE